MTHNTDKKLTIFVDASALKNSSCGLKLIYTTVQGYRGCKTNNDIIWGSAFHKFRALYRSGLEWQQAMKEAIGLFNDMMADAHIKDNKKYLTKGFLTSACMEYMEKYPMATDILQPIRDDAGVPLIEPVSRFAFPFRILPEVDILLAGTMDSMEHKKEEPYSPAMNLIVDAKTTGTWKIREFFNTFNLSPQLMMYRYAIRCYAKLRPDSIWAKLDKEPLGCMIEGIFHSSRENKDGEVKSKVIFSRCEKPIVFQRWQIDEFEVLLNQAVDKLVAHVIALLKYGIMPPREGIINGSCDTKYGPCQYAEACAAVDEEARDSIMDRTFTKSFYNPLAFS